MDQIVAALLEHGRFKFRKLVTDVQELSWLLIEAFEQGRITEVELTEIRRDADATQTLPLVRLYCERGRADAVCEFLRSTVSFNELGWFRRGHKGNIGTGTRRIFDALVDMGNGDKAATLALAHLSRVLVGARYNPGLRYWLRAWYDTKSLPPQFTAQDRIRAVPALHSRLLKAFPAMAVEVAEFGAIVLAHGTPDERSRLEAIGREVDAERERFDASLR